MKITSNKLDILSNTCRPWRWAKALFFVAAMAASLLLLSVSPLLVLLLDLLLPAALLSAASNSPITVPSLVHHLNTWNFSNSFVDLLLLSITRSIVILCAYLVCEGHGRVYPLITTMCSFASIGYVLVKMVAGCFAGKIWIDGDVPSGIEALFFCSVALAIAHLVVAYRTCFRERRKLLVYRIDIEAVKLKGVQIKGDSIL